LAWRSYSTEPEANKGEYQGTTAKAKEAEDETTKGDEGDPVKKELEAKDKEIIDLKVCVP